MEAFWYAETIEGVPWGNSVSYEEDVVDEDLFALIAFNLRDTMSQPATPIFVFIILQKGSLDDYRTERGTS